MPFSTRRRASRHPRISRLRRYDFDTHHLAFKQYGAGIDNFAFGIEPLSLLLWWGDLKAMRDGVAKVLDGHRRLLARVRQGERPGPSGLGDAAQLGHEVPYSDPVARTLFRLPCRGGRMLDSPKPVAVCRSPTSKCSTAEIQTVRT